MERVSLYVKKILALLLSAIVFVFAAGYIYDSGISFIDIFNHIPGTGLMDGMQHTSSGFPLLLLAATAFLLFAYLNFRMTGDKPRFLFGMNQSDTYLNKKGGFWNLFKWIVHLLGFLYDLIVWSVWGIYLLIVLFADFLLLIKTIVYWIIHALIWFIRQLFPPFIFVFKMFMHYILNWGWWLYRLSCRNMKFSLNRNFYVIALWGAIPALFIVFLFYAISQMVGIEELVVVSGVFAIIPLVWSYGEIAALRYEKREKDNYYAVKISFRNGFDAMKSILFYLLIILVLIAAEILINMLGWIPNISLSLLGISLNLNMAISLVLLFLAVIITFSVAILPTHILFHPEHENNLNSTLYFFQVIGKKCLRYLFVGIPVLFFGGLLLVIPGVLMLTSYKVTDSVKNSVLEFRVERLQEKLSGMDAIDAYRNSKAIDRLNMYMEAPLSIQDYLRNLRESPDFIHEMKVEKRLAIEQLKVREQEFNDRFSEILDQIIQADTSKNSEELDSLTTKRIDMKGEFLKWENNQKEYIAFKDIDLKEEKRVRTQLPVLAFFTGILFALFGGMVFAVFIAYIGNVYYDLYNMREDDKPTVWTRTIAELKSKDNNQPLLGFTFLGLMIAVFVVFFIIGGR